MGLLQSIAIHDVLHPPRVGLGAAMRLPHMSANAMPGQGGGFLDNITGSPLGQIGLALLMGGGGALGNAAAALMQMRALSAMNGPKLEHVGNSIGIVDPRTGQFTPTYSEPEKPTELEREIALSGTDPHSPEGQRIVASILQRRDDPIISTTLPGGPQYVGPQSGLLDAVQRLQGVSGAPGGLAPPTVSPAAPGGLAAAVVAAERSRGDLNPDGTPLTSPAGARFKMQVLPSTAHDPGYGVTPAANDSAEEYDRVGTDYINALAKHYGSPQAALAAYNMGPGNYDRSGGNLPAGVRSYVNRGMAALSGTSSGAPDAATIRSQAQAAIAAGADPNAVRARALQMGVTL